MKELFTTTTLLQMDPDQRDRSGVICAAINRYLERSGVAPDEITTLGDFVRSDHWEDYLQLNDDDPQQYPFFEVDDRGFFVKDLDFIHAYCLDGNSLSSFMNSIDRETVSAECILGQAFFYGLPSIATWFNRHAPRMSQVKAFELVLINLIEAERSLAEYFTHEGDLKSPLVTPRRTVVELHLQGLYSGFYGAFRNRAEPIFDQSVMGLLFSPVDSIQAAAYEDALRSVHATMVSDGGSCEDAVIELAQNLLVATTINPGFFMLVGGEPLEVIQESTRVKAKAWARLLGLDPVETSQKIEFLLLSIDPDLLAKANAPKSYWYDPSAKGVAQLSGALTGMSGYQSVPFAATYHFYRQHYEGALSNHVISMLEEGHHHIKSALDSEQGYHATVDELLQQGALSLNAIRLVGNELLKHRDTVNRYHPASITFAALALHEATDEQRRAVDKEILPLLVRQCEQAKSAIIARLEQNHEVTLKDLEATGLYSSDSGALMKKFKTQELGKLFAGDLGL